MIFVVSKQFIKSKWCDFESKVALSYHLGRTNGIIAIVFPGAHHYPAQNISMARFLDSVTYLEWSSKSSDIRRFTLTFKNIQVYMTEDVEIREKLQLNSLKKMDILP